MHFSAGINSFLIKSGPQQSHQLYIFKLIKTWSSNFTTTETEQTKGQISLIIFFSIFLLLYSIKTLWQGWAALPVTVPLTGTHSCPCHVHPASLLCVSISCGLSWDTAVVFWVRSIWVSYTRYTSMETHHIAASHHCILLLEEGWWCCLLYTSSSLDSNEAIEISWKAKEQSRGRKVFLINF